MTLLKLNYVYLPHSNDIPALHLYVTVQSFSSTQFPKQITPLVIASKFTLHNQVHIYSEYLSTKNVNSGHQLCESKLNSYIGIFSIALHIMQECRRFELCPAAAAPFLHLPAYPSFEILSGVVHLLLLTRCLSFCLFYSVGDSWEDDATLRRKVIYNRPNHFLSRFRPPTQWSDRFTLLKQPINLTRAVENNQHNYYCTCGPN